MKRIIFLLTTIFICTVAIAETINLHWLNDNGTTYTESTCTVNDDLIIPTTPPTKYGYTFTGWELLPFTPIEYLESTGTQWIDTGVIISGPNAKVILTFEINESQNSSFSGAQNYGTNWALIPHISNTNLHFYQKQSLQAALGINIELNKIYTLEMLQEDGFFTRTVNGISLHVQNQQTSYPTDVTYALFACKARVNFAIEFSKAKIYSAKIYDNDVLVRDFIPVLDKNGTPCMYDLVEHKFYYNAGTGQFIAGPIITD